VARYKLRNRNSPHDARQSAVSSKGMVWYLALVEAAKSTRLESKEDKARFASAAQAQGVIL